jgi:hypothetical protein
MLHTAGMGLVWASSAARDRFVPKQCGTPQTCPLRLPDLRGPCTGVHWCSPVILAVVTQIVTRPRCIGLGLA